MAAKPLTTEAIALTEKKVDMALDDIIKLSKTARTKSKGGHRAPNKNKKFVNNQPQDKAMKVRRFMDSRSSLRQGALAKRRSSFEENQFPLTTEAAQKAAVAPLHNRAFGHNRAPNWNKQRAGPQVVNRRPVNGGFPSKSEGLDLVCAAAASQVTAAESEPEPVPATEAAPATATATATEAAPAGASEASDSGLFVCKHGG